MSTTRLEAFSDGVVAILITIMVLDLKAPEGSHWSGLVGVVPSFLTYVMSFVFLGIYWNNHHHMLHLTDRVNGAILWANLHLLFWLSLVPFATGWMADSHSAPWPTASYGVVLLCAAIAFQILQRAIMAHQGSRSRLRSAVGQDRKGKISSALYVLAIPLAFVHPAISDAIYVLVALTWLVPDRRVERLLDSERERS